MKATVCELSNEPDRFEEDWRALAGHVHEQGSDLVLLPELPFHPWFAWTRPQDPAVWRAVVAAHQAWEARLDELGARYILVTRAVERDGERHNEGYLWEAGVGTRPAHVKYYLPEDEGFWESSWYQRGDGRFEPVQAGLLSIGFLICTEIWFLHHAREYGKQGVHLIVCPRATGKPTTQKWLVAGRAAAVVSGAYCLSSNRISAEGSPADLGGLGWIVDPDGEVLALTSSQDPFVTCEIDLSRADHAKSTYPRYVED
ncbi:MAG TPA: carbon-nitrogen hydrolase family protein [Anaerolineaceae bacterium]|nr:carbon-nitrogen hydrolase family protein [Anaerolineaceae bacterium]